MKIHLRNKITRGKRQVKRKEEESGRQRATSGLSRLLILCFAEKKKKKATHSQVKNTVEKNHLDIISHLQSSLFVSFKK